MIKELNDIYLYRAFVELLKSIPVTELTDEELVIIYGNLDKLQMELDK